MMEVDRLQGKTLLPGTKYAVIATIVFTFFLIVWMTQPARADVQELPDLPQVVLAGGEAYPPFEYVDSRGEYRGFDVDLLKAISLVEGFDLILKPMPFSEARQALADRKVDGLLGMNISQARDGIYNFSKSYLTMSQSIFVGVDNYYIVHPEDLANSEVAVQAGDIAGELLATYQPLESVMTKNTEEAFHELLDGNVDAVVANELTGMFLVQKIHAEKNLKMVGGTFLTNDYGVAVNKGNTAFLQKINHGLDTLRQNGTYDKIHTRWFGQVLDKPKVSSQTVVFLMIGLGILLFVIIVVVVWNRLLAKMVSRRTLDLAKVNTRLAQVNGELLRANDLKEAVLDSVFTGIITLDGHGKVLSLNRPALRILEGEMSDVIGHTLQGLVPFDGILPAEIFERGNTPFIHEQMVKIHGQERRLKFNLFAMDATEFPHHGFILSFADITEEWLLHQHLEHQDKLEALGQMAAGIAHEIRNPLTSIKGFIQLLPFKVEDPQFRQSLVTVLPEEVNRLEGIVNEMLDLTQKKGSVRSEWELASLVQKVVSLLEKAPEAREITFTVEVAPEHIVFADEQQMKQVVINLVLNAIAAISARIPESGKVLAEGRIVLRSKRLNDKIVLLEIEDNGCGIPADIQKKVFDPFFTTKRNGTGLGLATAHQHLTENNGQIMLASTEGQGTVISVYLPTP